MFWKRHGWKVAYFFLGTIGIIGVGRLFMPFWLRFFLLTAWALGMAAIFIRFMGASREERTGAAPEKHDGPAPQ
ncbi:MAG: hypothetical protein H0S85_16700 [Desulfovibrionaceae bacterium]|jgi:hypothetical protein|nr:hypothetical protein [Desulfovibrionaceae bacterium]